MQLRNPYFEENMCQDQPYASLLLIAPYCDGACPGCHNNTLRLEDIKYFLVDDIVDIYKSNPFVEGITVGGLEITLSGESFIEDLIEVIRRGSIPKVTIYTRQDKNHSKLQEILGKLTELNCIQELYVKTGGYNCDLPKHEVVLGDWSLTLASCNQQFDSLK